MDSGVLGVVTERGVVSIWRGGNEPGKSQPQGSASSQQLSNLFSETLGRNEIILLLICGGGKSAGLGGAWPAVRPRDSSEEVGGRMSPLLKARAGSCRSHT